MALAVKKDMLVTLSVRMADMSGKILEESGPEGLTYLHGHGDIFPKLEAALEGRFPGEGFFIKLEPEDAFGEYDPDSLVMVPVERLGNPETVVRGLVFEGVPGEANDGRRWHVTDIADGMAVLETNHPLAGMALQFEVKVTEVAEPSDEDAVGDDNVVVPGFLSIADRIVSEDEEDESDETMDRMLEEHAHPDDSAMARMASAAPRITTISFQKAVALLESAAFCRICAFFGGITGRRASTSRGGAPHPRRHESSLHQVCRIRGASMHARVRRVDRLHQGALLPAA